MSEAPRNDPRFAEAPGVGSARLWILAALAFGTAFVAIRQFSSRTSEGEAADYNWSLTTLDGQPVSFAKFKGRPIFLNVWATWCGPCVREMPSIARLAASPSLAGKVDFVCVATDESIESVRRFVQTGDFPMMILHDPGNPPPTFRTDGIPATFIIAPDGRIVRASVGSEEWDRPDIVRILEELAAETR